MCVSLSITGLFIYFYFIYIYIFLFISYVKFAIDCKQLFRMLLQTTA